MKIELRWAYNNLSNIMTPPYTLPMIPPIKQLLFNYFTKLVLFLIYIPDYCNLLTYKHYQKVAFFGSIFGSIIIKCYLSSFYLWIPSNILFIIYLLFVVKFVGAGTPSMVGGRPPVNFLKILIHQRNVLGRMVFRWVV